MSTKKENENSTSQKTTSKKMVPIAQNQIPDTLKLLPVFKNPLFPGIMIPMNIDLNHLSPSIERELKPNQFVAVMLVKKKYSSFLIEEIDPSMTYKVGTVGRIIKKVYLPDGSLNLLINCFNRIEILEQLKNDAVDEMLYDVKVKHLKEKDRKDDLETKVLINTILEQMTYISKNNPFLMDQIHIAVQESDSPSRIADFIASLVGDFSKERLQKILETLNVRDRLEKIAILLEERLKVVQLQEKLMNDINNKVEKQQRDFFLREELKAIQDELGVEENKQTKDLKRLQKMFQKLRPHLMKEVQESLEGEIEKLASLDSRAPDYSMTFNYLETALALPWNKKTKDSISLEKAEKILHKDHYGLDDVKTRILEFLAIRKLKPSLKGTTLCFVGPPGVGKTSLGKAIAEALNRPFFRFSVGGMRDEAEIKGHRRTYIGAMPGKLIQGLKITKSLNPVFMLDEIDKIGSHYQGDPSSALLEVLDPEQNFSFRDHYLDLPFDLSEVLFITTANSLSTIPPALLDRMEIIRISGYIAEEKYMIGKSYILEKQKRENGLEKSPLTLTKQAFLYIAEKYSREAGVRNFERQIGKLCRKIAYQKAIGKKIPSKIAEKDIPTYLGTEIFSADETKRIQKAGVAIGLAWTSLGGDTLYIESILLPSQKGGLQLTGQLGDVMKESANIAYSYIKSIAQKYSIKKDIIDSHIIHLHVPAGATPKDGPSAGITMACSIYSLLSQKKIPQNFAMTGELTLTGNVLPIGGLKEKSLAALRSKTTNIIAPLENKKDLEDIPALIKDKISYHFVSTLEEIFEILFKK